MRRKSRTNVPLSLVVRSTKPPPMQTFFLTISWLLARDIFHALLWLSHAEEKKELPCTDRILIFVASGYGKIERRTRASSYLPNDPSLFVDVDVVLPDAILQVSEGSNEREEKTHECCFSRFFSAIIQHVMNRKWSCRYQFDRRHLSLGSSSIHLLSD